MSDTRLRPRKGIVVFIVLLVLLVTLIVAGMIVRYNSQQQAATGGEGIPSAPSGLAPSYSVTSSPSEVPTLSPSEILDDIETEDLPEVYVPRVSAELQPSLQKIWEYEKAYFSPDPEVRESLMKTLAVEQYLANDLSREPAKFQGIEVHVVVDESEIVSISVGDNRFTCYIVTDVFLETVRDGEVVNRLPGPRHASLWVNTEHGWRVLKDLGEV